MQVIGRRGREFRMVHVKPRRMHAQKYLEMLASGRERPAHLWSIEESRPVLQGAQTYAGTWSYLPPGA